MEFLHVDIWITSGINPNIYAISSGAEIANPITNAGAGTWTSIDIPVGGITGDLTSVRQFKFDGGSGSADSIYVDNLYFWKNATTPQNDATLSDLKVDGETVAGFSSGILNYTVDLPSGTTTVPQITAATTTAANATTTITQATAIPGDATVVVESEDETRTKTYTVSFKASIPANAAPTPPARDAAQVISIYSDAYADITLDALSADFDDSDVTEVMIEGNATLKVDFSNFLGINFPSNKQDASQMTKLHIDFWTPEVPIGGVFNSKLVNFADGNAETSAIQFNVNAGTDPALTAGTWISADFDLPSGVARDSLAQYIITVSNTLDVVYIDNIYLYTNDPITGGGSTLPETFDTATSIETWTKAGDASTKESEVTFEWAETAGVDASGAMRFGGTNADGAGGRAYILEKTFTEVDFEGATNVDVSVSIKSESITDANISILTDIGGSIQENASANSLLSDSEFTTFTFNHAAISGTANSVKLSFNVAAGAVMNAGGTLLIDDIQVSVADTSGGGGEFVGLVNGDFELGNDGSWYGNALDIRTEGGNSYNFADVATAGNGFDVNLSQLVTLTAGESYTLTFEASTGAGNTRDMIVGIGQSEAPFLSATKVVSLTETNTEFTVELVATDDATGNDFGGATSRVLFDMGAATGVVVIDNVSLEVAGSTGGDPMPEIAAPTPPARNAADVISLFSNAYTNVDVTTWSTEWSEGSTNTDIVIEGDDVKRFDLVRFSGIQLASSIDLSTFTNMHIDYWVADDLTGGEVFNPKLSNHGNLPDAAGETNAVILTNPVTESKTWVSLDVPLADFTIAGGGSDAKDKIYQIILGADGTLDNVYIDNFYFYKGMPVSNERDDVPAGFALNQNYPNPFNPTTNISFNLPTAGEVTLEVYNIQGQKVATLVNGFKSSGSHSVAFDASNLASGVYAYRLISKNSVQVKKMLLIK